MFESLQGLLGLSLQPLQHVLWVQVFIGLGQTQAGCQEDVEAPPAPFTPTDLLGVACSPCLPQAPPSPRGALLFPCLGCLHIPVTRLSISAPERRLEGTGWASAGPGAVPG